MNESNMAAGAAVGAIGSLSPRYNDLEKATSERQATPEEIAAYRSKKAVREQIEASHGTVNRVLSALEGALRGEATPLLKSDLDNAARHAAQLVKQVRAVKAAIFPKVEKPTNGTDTTQAQQ